MIVLKDHLYKPLENIEGDCMLINLNFFYLTQKVNLTFLKNVNITRWHSNYFSTRISKIKMEMLLTNFPNKSLIVLTVLLPGSSLYEIINKSR